MFSTGFKALVNPSNSFNATASSAVVNLTTIAEDTNSDSIHGLIANTQWVALRQVLETSISAAQREEAASNPTLLHQAIENGAPKSILMLIAITFPEALSRINDQNRFPIHVACAHGASPSFIFHCLDTCPVSAGAPDKEGMTPVIILCQKYKRSYQSKFPHKLAEKKMEQILWMIYRRAPATIVLEDKSGKSAIEYALEAEVNMEFFKTLQHLIIHFNQNNVRKLSARMKQDKEAAMKLSRRRGGNVGSGGSGGAKRPPAAFAA